MSQVEATYDIPMYDRWQIRNNLLYNFPNGAGESKERGHTLPRAVTNLDIYACPLDPRRGTTGKCQAVISGSWVCVEKRILPARCGGT
jgi:hypothetical protein